MSTTQQQATEMRAMKKAVHFFTIAAEASHPKARSLAKSVFQTSFCGRTSLRNQLSITSNGGWQMQRSGGCRCSGGRCRNLRAAFLALRTSCKQFCKHIYRGCSTAACAGVYSNCGFPPCGMRLLVPARCFVAPSPHHPRRQSLVMKTDRPQLASDQSHKYV